MKTQIFTLVFSSLCLGAVFARPAEYEGKRLIKTSESDNGQWVDEATMIALKKIGVSFIDITDRHAVPRSFQSQPDEHISQIPTAPRYQSTVSGVLNHIDSQRQRSFIVSFSDYFTRQYNTKDGEDSALWLLSQAQVSIDSANYPGKASAQVYKHSWRQPSVIAKLEGSDPSLKNEIVILGAHLDSTNFYPSSPAPGADDNASGSVVLLETLRVLLQAGFIPKRTIEFQWYAAEEVGLRGSGDIAEEYSRNNVKVISMVNFDVVGYFAGDESIGIVTDRTNKQLSTFIRLVVDEYLLWKWKDTSCGYGCSDHASFTSYGFAAAFPVEIDFHPDMHTARDTVDQVNFEQLKEFTKLAVGYAIEVAEPSEL